MRRHARHGNARLERAAGARQTASPRTCELGIAARDARPAGSSPRVRGTRRRSGRRDEAHRAEGMEAQKSRPGAVVHLVGVMYRHTKRLSLRMVPEAGCGCPLSGSLSTVTGQAAGNPGDRRNDNPPQNCAQASNSLAVLHLPLDGDAHAAIPQPPADVDTALEHKIFDLSQRQRVADIHHHREADDLWRTVEIAEGISHLAKLWMPHLHINPFFLTTPCWLLHAPYRPPAGACRPPGTLWTSCNKGSLTGDSRKRGLATTAFLLIRDTPP